MYIFAKYGIIRLVLFFVFRWYTELPMLMGFGNLGCSIRPLIRSFGGVKMTFLFLKKILIFRSHLKLLFNIALLWHVEKMFYFIFKFFNIS